MSEDVPKVTDFVTVPKADVASDLRDSSDKIRLFVSSAVAPATGNIDKKDGTPVTLVLQNFWKNPTIKWLLGILGAALLSAGYKVYPMLASGHIDMALLLTTLKTEIVASLIASFSMYLRTRNNNPVNAPKIGN